MKFYLQREDQNYKNDFVFSLYSIIENENFGRTEPKYEIVNVSYNDVLNSDIDSRGIYVGSIDFMKLVFTKFGVNIPKPINIPKSIQEYCNREIWTGVKSDIKIPCFLKPLDDIKLFTGFLLEKNLNLNLYYPEILDDTKLLFSEPINITSEWRVFVYKNQIVGMNNYNYDFKIFPNIDLIEECIREYSDSPIAYTIDFAVTRDNKTLLIEVNDFWSCGTYGFSEYCLPNMFAERFRQITMPKKD